MVLFFSDSYFPPTPHLLLQDLNVWTITSDIMQRQEDDAFAVNQKQGQDGVTNSAGFKRNGRKNPTFNTLQEWYLFYFMF